MTNKLICNCYLQCGCKQVVENAGRDCDDCFSDHAPTIEREKMSKPTPEYYQAKADLCEKLAIEQIWSGNTDMGMRNIMRMTHALAEIQLTEREGENE
jgi:hypothetical protein